jgi:hypothetical protein
MEESISYGEWFESNYSLRVTAIGRQVRISMEGSSEPIEMDILDLLLLKRVARALGYWNDANETGDMLGNLYTMRAANEPVNDDQLHTVINLAQRALNSKHAPTRMEFAQALARTLLIQKQSNVESIHSFEPDTNDWWELNHE